MTTPFWVIVAMAWKEIRANARMSLVFILNLSIGLSGLLLIDTLRGTIDQTLSSRSRQILGADLSISARRPFTAEEQSRMRTVLGKDTPESQVLELYSMIKGPIGSRLVQVQAVDQAYPFYGRFLLEPSGDVRSAMALNTTLPSLWIPPDLSITLGAKLGDRIQLGDTTFQVTNLIREDIAASGGGFLLATRVYIGLQHLPATRMIRPGSTVTYRQLFKLRPGQNVDALAKKIDAALQDPGIRVTAHTRASEMTGRLQGFLNDYLGLAALVGLFLASLGSAYVYRGFLVRRVRDMGILISLGLDPVRARWMVRVQLVLLGGCAAWVAIVITMLISPLAIRSLSAFLPLAVEARMELMAMLRTLLLGSVGSLLIGAPLLARFKTLSPAALFQENAAPELESRQEWLSILPALILFWLLAVWESHSWRTGSLFVGVLLAATVILGVGAGFFLKGLDRVTPKAPLFWRLPVRHLSRQRFSSISGFLAIGLGAFLLNLIPQVQKSLSTEVVSPGTGDVPNFFLFDIQPEQLDPLQNFVRESGHALQGLSPLVRGRLTAINGKPFEKETQSGSFKTREEETEGRFRNRSFNLSWRGELFASEKMVAGRPFAANVPEIPEISVEQRFAKRLKLKLQDVMTFDVQGVEISGRIVNLRSVQWTSFQPNFFVQFQPGVLEGAPATFIASIGGLSRSEKRGLQDAIVSRFSNVSIIDVSDVVTRMLSIITQMAWAIRAMAFLALGAGFVVLFSIAQQQAATRRSETLLLKVLGANFSFLQRMAWLEFGGLGAFAAASGALLSLAASGLFSQFLFEQVWVVDLLTPTLVTLALTLASLLAATLATRTILRQKPWALLQESPS